MLIEFNSFTSICFNNKTKDSRLCVLFWNVVINIFCIRINITYDGIIVMILFLIQIFELYSTWLNKYAFLADDASIHDYYNSQCILLHKYLTFLCPFSHVLKKKFKYKNYNIASFTKNKHNVILYVQNIFSWMITCFRIFWRIEGFSLFCIHFHNKINNLSAT